MILINRGTYQDVIFMSKLIKIVRNTTDAGYITETDNCWLSLDGKFEHIKMLAITMVYMIYG